MGASEKQRGSDAPYHHGDLRRALLEAADEILRETGRWDFSLREVARRAGVSHNAPYRHFADKEALLSAIGVSGYAKLRAAGAAAAAGANGPGQVLAALGKSYVAFGLANPALYKLMFGQALPRTEGLPPTLAEAIGIARDALRDVIMAGALDRSFDVDPSDEAEVTAATVGAWSVVHGLTLLTVDQVVRPDGASDPTGFGTADVVDAFVDGLVVEAERAARGSNQGESTT